MNAACIFVLDDDPSITEVTKIILEEEGYQVIVGQSEEDLHIGLAKVTPAVILMDVWLAQTEGNQITRRLKGNPKTAHIPIILFSALNEIELITKQAGADGFLRKPYEMKELVALVKRFV